MEIESCPTLQKNFEAKAFTEFRINKKNYKNAAACL